MATTSVAQIRSLPRSATLPLRAVAVAGIVLLIIRNLFAPAHQAFDAIPWLNAPLLRAGVLLAVALCVALTHSRVNGFTPSRPFALVGGTLGLALALDWAQQLPFGAAPLVFEAALVGALVWTLYAYGLVGFGLRVYCWLAIGLSAVGIVGWLVSTVASTDSAALWAMPDSRAALLGFTWHRATGLFPPPTTATFFTAPALFVVPLVAQQRTHRLGLLAMLAVFLLLSHAAANILILLILALLVIGRQVWRARWRWREVGGILAVICVGWLLLQPEQTVGGKFRDEGPEHVGYAISAARAPLFGGWGPLTAEGAPTSSLSSLAAVAHTVAVAGLGLVVLFSKRRWWYLGGALVYIAAHGLKQPVVLMTSDVYLFLAFALAILVGIHEAPHSNSPAHRTHTITAPR